MCVCVCVRVCTCVHVYMCVAGMPLFFFLVICVFHVTHLTFIALCFTEACGPLTLRLMCCQPLCTSAGPSSAVAW